MSSSTTSHDPDRCQIASRAFVAGVLAAARKGLSRRELSERTGFELCSICARVDELLGRGLIRELPDKVVCPVTKRKVKQVISA